MDIRRHDRLHRLSHRTLSAGSHARHTETPDPRDVNSTSTAISTAPGKKIALARSWGQTLYRAARNSLIGVLAGTSLMGALAASHNYDAIAQEVSATNPVEPTNSPVTPPQRWDTSTPTRTQPLSTSAARQLFEKVSQSPQVQKLLSTQVAEVQSQVNAQLSHLPAIAQTNLVDVKAPLPTGDGTLLGVGPSSLSLGIHDLKTETVPVKASITTRVGALAARVSIDPVQVEHPAGGPPGGVYLGSFHTQVKAASPTVEVTGQVAVGLDLDGQGTQAELKQQQANLATFQPGSAEYATAQQNIQRLNERLVHGHHLEQAARHNGFDKDMETVMAGQGSNFKLDLPLSQTTPLVDGYNHLWLVPGPAGGAPHIVLTDDLSTPGLDHLSIPAPQLTALPHANKDGLVLDGLRQAVQGTMQEQIGKVFGSVAQTIPTSAHDTVARQFYITGTAVQKAANAKIDQLYSEATHLEVSVQKTLEAVPPAPPTAPTPRPPLTSSPGSTALPARTLQEIYTAVQKTSTFQRALQDKIAASQVEVQQQLDALPPITQQQLIDVKVKLPPDMAALAGASSVTAPLVVTETGKVSPVKVRVEVTPVALRDAPTKDGMVYLGSYRTSVYAKSPTAHIDGTATVTLDDGKATQAELKSVQEQLRGVDPGSTRGKALQTNLQRLQTRLKESQSLSHLTTAVGASRPLSALLDGQGVKVAMDVQLPTDTPLLTGMVHVFAAPGPDGVPRIVTADQLATPGIDALKVSNTEVAPLPYAPSSHEPAALEQMHAAIAEHIQKAASDILAQESKGFPALIHGRAQEVWKTTIQTQQAAANAQIERLVQNGMDTSPGGLRATIEPVVKEPRTTPAPLAATPVPDGSMALVIPRQTVDRLMAQVQASPHMRQEIDKTTSDIAAMLSKSQVQDGHELVDVKGPGGLYFPLILTHHFESGGVPARVQITPELLPPGERPVGPKGAVYVGSFKSELWATQKTLPASGRVSVALDTDGAATASELKDWQTRAAATDPHGAEGRAIQANIDRLEARMASVRQLQEVKLPTDAQAAIDALIQQQVEVQTQVTLPTDRPLVTGVDHVWLTQDGLVVTSEMQAPGSDGVGLQETSLRVLDHPVPAGFEGMQKIIADTLQRGGQKAAGSVAEKLPGRMRAQARETWDQSTVTLQREANKELQAFYSQHTGLTIPLGDGKVASPLQASLVRFVPTANGDVAAIVQTPGPHESFDVPIATANPQDSIEAVVSGDSISTLLKDQTHGGNINWRGLLADVAKANKLHSLEFNHDAQGNALSPHLVMRDGRVRAEFDMTAVKTGPAILRPQVTIHVSVPLQFDAADGVLTARLDTRGLEVSHGEGSSGRLMFPTQWPGSAIGQSLIKHHGADMLGPSLSTVTIPLDLQGQKVDITGLRAMPNATGGVDLHVQAQLQSSFSLESLDTLH